MKAIAHTVFPPNYSPEFTGKKADKRFNEWQLYINGIKPQNLPKKGGIAYEEEQERLLDTAKDLLVTNAKR